MDKVYKPQKIETQIYQNWKTNGRFSPSISEGKEPFCIIMPPPNANAQLHVGHAMFITIEDILTRYHRMKGDSVLWIPGADHAGILTQVVFERYLGKIGKTRYDLGRKEFYKQCFDFTQRNKAIMYNQMEKLGASCDWSREKFTLNKKISETVLETFVHLYNDGLVYRDWRMINWCPRCMTAISDLEVEWVEKTDPLYFLTYGPFSLATTRPETKFGDTAVAVNPKDKRYKKWIGKEIEVTGLIGTFTMKVVADEAVDPKFGTGVIKVTPAHDFVDFDIGKRHDLEIRRVIAFNGKLNERAGMYAGLRVKKARITVAEDLKKKGFLVKIKENYTHRVALCERCKTTIEPMVSLQWFIKTKPLAKPAKEAVRKGKIKILPKWFEKTYYQWMDNIEDWCVSRQIWWGHQMPVWYCGTKGLSKLQKSMNPDLIKGKKEGCGETIIQIAKPKKCNECGNIDIIQEPDTFDTWFSSAQWSYTTLGFSWEGKHDKDYISFYPTSVMETGYEILFFWVARMIMIGIYTTGHIPFKTVYLHGLVRDAFGKKMSKSRGNVIDPLDVINKYGADALRLALVWGIAPGSDSNIGDEKIRGMRNFANKLWNIGRFLYINLCYVDNLKSVPMFDVKMSDLTRDDKKIIKELKKVIHISTINIEKFRLSDVAQSIYDFTWHELADLYIESIKDRLQNLSTKNKNTPSYRDGLVALSVLQHIYANTLKILHPFMPFVTEELWDKVLGNSEQPLITASWPKE